MSTINYFRRPTLAGKNLTFPTYSRIRGSVRRSDPDGVSAVPYFPTVSATQTLNVATQAGLVTVTLTGNALSVVLADINTALAGAARAVDDDGCIAIESLVAGGAGAVGVSNNPGTAGIGLGFDTVNGFWPILGVAQNLSSAPEGRLGNPYGAAFIRNENISSEVINRNFGRLSANTDVLWSDHVKQVIVYESVPFSVGAFGISLTPTPTGNRFFIGRSTISEPQTGLNASSTKRDLAAYYQIIDNVTGLPANSQVHAIVRGTAPLTFPPYADSPSWADATGKNILGLDQDKVTASAITAMSGGRFVTCAGATFITTKVEAGDYAEIAGATNLGRWSNDGYIWVVEEVISETMLALRPMSEGEIAFTGTTSGVLSIQPVIELNDTKVGIEVFGTLTVRTGPFASDDSGVTLCVAPPIPSGANYKLIAAVAGSLKSEMPHRGPTGAIAASSVMGGDFDPSPEWVLHGLDPTLSGADCAVTAGFVRQFGKVFRIPARTLLAAEFADGVNYVFWSEFFSDLRVSQIVSGWADVLNDTFHDTWPTGAQRGHPIAKVTKAGGVVTSVKRMVRRTGEKATPLTVGVSGQFQTLEDAVRYANAIAENYAEGVYSEGAYPHFEYVLVSNTTLTENVTFTGQKSILLRGVNPAVVLNTGAFLITVGAATNIVVRDLFIDGTAATFLTLTGVNAKILFQNLLAIDNGFGTLIKSVAGSAQWIDIENCSFTVTSRLLEVAAFPTSNSRIRLSDSTFYATGASQVIRGEAASAWLGTTLVIDKCNFRSAWLATVAADALLIDMTAVTGKALVRDVVFSVGIHASTSNFFFASFGGEALIENVRFTDGKISRAIAGTATTKVIDCDFRTNTQGGAVIVAREVRNTKITHLDTDGSANGGWAIQPIGFAPIIEDNEITGPFSTVIFNECEDPKFCRNSITMSFIANAVPAVGIDVEGAFTQGGIVEGNTITVLDGSHGVTAIDISQAVNVTVSDNIIRMQNLTAATQTHVGIQAYIAERCVIEGNIVETVGARIFGVTQSIRGISVEGAQSLSVVGNVITLDATGIAPWYGIYVGISSTRLSICNNTVKVWGYPFQRTSTGSDDCTISGNTFISTTSDPTFSDCGTLSGTVSNNIFQQDASIAYNVYLSVGSFTGNKFYGTVQVLSSASTDGKPFVFTGNYVSGSIVFSGALTSRKVLISDNTIVQSDRTANGISFPTNATETNEFVITGNSVTLGAVGGNAVIGSCVYFAGTARRLLVTGNRFSMLGNADPGGTLSPFPACVKVVGNGGIVSTGITISSNFFEKPADAAYRAGAFVVTYSFFDTTNSSELGGAGNTWFTGVTTPGAGAYQGGVIAYHVGPGNFAL